MMVTRYTSWVVSLSMLLLVSCDDSSEQVGADGPVVAGHDAAFGEVLGTDGSATAVVDGSTMRDSEPAEDVAGDAPSGVDANPVMLDTGLIGYWKFDEGSGTHVGDSSGNANHGTVIEGNASNAAAHSGPTWVDGVKGQAVRQNGTLEWVRVTTSESLDSSHLNEEVSISAWIKLAQAQDVVDETYIVARADPLTGGSIFGIRLFYGGVPEGQMGPQVARAMESVGPDTWTHLVFTFGGGAVRIYINGEQAGVLHSGAYFERSAILSMGAQLDGTAVRRHLDGVIDEVRIYNRGLNADEVKALWGQ